MSSEPTVINIVILSTAPTGFEHSSYRVAADREFTINFTNSFSDEAVKLSLLISPASDPAIARVPGKAGFGTITMSKAIYVSDPVPGRGRTTFRVNELAAGSYVLQVRERPGRFAAQLIVE